jgi:hypothetical protein
MKMGTSKVSGLRVFLLMVLHLVSTGKCESMSQIQAQLEQGNLVCYLSEKYPGDFNSSDFDFVSVEEYYNQYIGYTEADAYRKYCIEGENSGLLFIVALGLNEI